MTNESDLISMRSELASIVHQAFINDVDLQAVDGIAKESALNFWRQVSMNLQPHSRMKVAIFGPDSDDEEPSIELVLTDQVRSVQAQVEFLASGHAKLWISGNRKTFSVRFGSSISLANSFFSVWKDPTL